MSSRKGTMLLAGAVGLSLGLFAIPGTASAGTTVLAEWTFDVTPPDGNAGPVAADNGTGSALVNTGGTISTPAGNGTSDSWSSTGWDVGEYWQFSTSTTNYQDITIQWDQTSSNTGPRDFQLAYSTDGVSFTNIGSAYMVLANASPNMPWSSGTYLPEYTFGPIAGPAALDDQATIFFRMTNTSTVSANGGTVASGGTDRIDSVIISGTLIPEPASLAFVGAAGLLAMRRRRA